MKSYTFQASVWLYPGTSAAWHFVSLPKKEAEQIKKSQEGKARRGWGAVRIRVIIGGSSWETSMFPDKKSGTYLLPLKAQVRKKEGITAKDTITVLLQLVS